MIEQDDEIVAKFKARMAEALGAGDLDSLIQLESAYYQSFIKARENIDHYERAYDAIDSLISAVGDRIQSMIPAQNDENYGNKVCYLLPSLDNDLAHIEFIFNILKMHPSDAALEIFVAGFSKDLRSIQSRLLYKLYAERRVKLIPISFSFSGMIDFARVFLREKIALLVVYSIPSMLSAWVRALGPRRVAWATTKFELSSFRELEIRLSFSGPHKETREIRGKNWRRSTAAIVVTEAERFDPMGRPQTRLISVNREEKIFTQPFMSAVVAILRANPKVTFHWTGRNQNAAISEYFLSHGVADRCVFLGWVDPQKALPAYDIFLDTYGLSGVVATKAFCMGMPTVFFRDSKAWIEIHEERLSGSHLNRQMLSRVLVDDSSAYQASVLRLVQSQSDYVDTSKWQVETGREFLGNEMNMYESHVEILRELLVNITSECGRRCN